MSIPLLWSDIHKFEDIRDIADFLTERQAMCIYLAGELDLVTVTCMLTNKDWKEPECPTMLAEIIDNHHRDTPDELFRRICYALKSSK
jgi:hypothetical protein